MSQFRFLHSAPSTPGFPSTHPGSPGQAAPFDAASSHVLSRASGTGDAETDEPTYPVGLEQTHGSLMEKEQGGHQTLQEMCPDLH